MHKDLQLRRRVQAQSRAQSTRPAAARSRCQRPRHVIAAGKPRRCVRGHQERQLPCVRDWRHRLPLVRLGLGLGLGLGLAIRLGLGLGLG